MDYKIIGSDFHKMNISKCEEMMIPRTAGGYTQGFILIDYTGLKSPWKHCVAIFWDSSRGAWANKTIKNKKDCKTLEEAGVDSIINHLEEDSQSISEIIARQGYAWIVRELVNTWRRLGKDKLHAIDIANMAKKIAKYEKEK